MDLKPSRLRRGELVASLSAVVLLAVLFALPWFRVSAAAGGDSDVHGWSALPTLRWLIIVTAIAALLLAFFQAARSAPALPVTMSVIVAALGVLTGLALVIRLPTASGTPLAGAFIGLAAAAGVAVGGYLSLRQEGGWLPGPDHPIEPIVIGSPPDRS
jgi:hypothetical protein